MNARIIIHIYRTLPAPAREAIKSRDIVVYTKLDDGEFVNGCEVGGKENGTSSPFIILNHATAR
jgi:hypothetical protein